MYLFLIILFLALAATILLFAIALKVRFAFNSDNADINLVLLWLYPFLKAVITNEKTELLLTVYVFNKSILKKFLKRKPGKHTRGLELIKQINPTDINVNAEYCFKDPFVTGTAYGAMNIVSHFIGIDSFHQSPDFAGDKDYIYMDGTAKVNIGTALINLARSHI